MVGQEKPKYFVFDHWITILRIAEFAWPNTQKEAQYVTNLRQYIALVQEPDFAAGPNG